MVFSIISADFERTDGLVKFIIQVDEAKMETDNLEKRNSEKRNYDAIDKNKLWKDKVRIPKYQIQYLKNVLKMPQSFQNINSFYGLYGPKMISMDFGLLELFNVKSSFKYNLDQFKQFDQSTQFMRWGRIIDLKLQDNKYIHQQCKLNYYLLLLKERLYSIRTCLFYKNDSTRKSFPYTYLFVFEMQDTIQFCLSSLKRQRDDQSQLSSQEIRQSNSRISQGAQLSQISQSNQSYTMLIEKKMIHYQKYSQQDIRNYMKLVIIPFQIFVFNEEQEFNYIQILAEVQIKIDNDSKNQRQQQQNYGTLNLIKFCDFEIQQNETKLIREFIEKALIIKIKISTEQNGFNQNDEDQICSLVEYIEFNYLVQRSQQNDIQQWKEQIFNGLPKHLLTNPPNSILPIQYLFPNDEKSINYYRQQFK